MAKKLNHLDDFMGEPSLKQIAEKLRHELHMGGVYPDETGYGGAVTISCEKFYNICDRKQLRKRLYTEVELEASRLGLIVAFGRNAMVVASDSNFAQDGWSEWDWNYSRRRT